MRALREAKMEAKTEAKTMPEAGITAAAPDAEAFPGSPSGRIRQLVATGAAAVVRHISVDDWALSLSEGEGGKGYGFDSGSDPSRLLFSGKPLANWLCRTSRKLLRGVTEDCVIKAKYTMKRPVAMRCEDRTVKITVLEVWYVCRIRYRLHSSHALLGSVGYDSPLLSARPDVKPDYHVYHPVRSVEGKGIPEVDACIETTKIVFESGALKLGRLKALSPA